MNLENKEWRRQRQELIDATKKDSPKNPKERALFLNVISIASELGFVIAFPLVTGAILGTSLDTKFGSQPKFTLSLIFLGTIISVYNVYILIRRMIKE